MVVVVVVAPTNLKELCERREVGCLGFSVVVVVVAFLLRDLGSTFGLHCGGW